MYPRQEGDEELSERSGEACFLTRGVKLQARRQ